MIIDLNYEIKLNFLDFKLHFNVILNWDYHVFHYHDHFLYQNQNFLNYLNQKLQKQILIFFSSFILIITFHPFNYLNYLIHYIQFRIFLYHQFLIIYVQAFS